jgi:STE24 endopeptidase
MNQFSTIFIILLMLGTMLQLWLSLQHFLHIKKHKTTVPQGFVEKISLKDHSLAANYTMAKIKVQYVDLIFGAILLALWTVGGGIHYLDSQLQTFELSPIWLGIVVILGVTLISDIIGLPLEIYKTFVTEEKFGFNKTTPQLYIKDWFVNNLVSFAIMIPLLATVLWLMDSTGTYWWLLVWAVFISFMLFMMWAYPTFIAPLYNKFTPLEDQELKQKIEKLLDSGGFHCDGIFVMDGSKRSGHGNAYFTGLGSKKRIVFFDTLLESLTHEEIEAVLAHELGHFKHKHIVKKLINTSAISLGCLALLGWLIEQNWFFNGLAIDTPSNHLAILLFMLIFPVFNIFFTPIFSFLSRKQEFEADEYAVSQTGKIHLPNALVKMYKDNASTLTPSPIYSAFYDSHPPAPIRINHIQSLGDS